MRYWPKSKWPEGPSISGVSRKKNNHTLLVRMQTDSSSTEIHIKTKWKIELYYSEPWSRSFAPMLSSQLSQNTIIKTYLHSNVHHNTILIAKTQNNSNRKSSEWILKYDSIIRKKYYPYYYMWQHNLERVQIPIWNKSEVISYIKFRGIKLKNIKCPIKIKL